ncbi:unnamed protein product [Blepharisma stoltei]|uniref:Enoyl reductase (ER) domain-containing protein n=1 Tax=Blepharisma stoltei TaxID=1481888 RepID=A0AAU9K3Z5_9CILI|nr:unnamed protein product [Blepharisma stoltei]
MTDKLRALTIDRYGDINSMTVKELKIPKDIPENFVLIRNEFASLHPADEYIYMGNFSELRLSHNTLGLNGSGTVIKSGGGVLANSLLNKRVTFMTYGPNNTGSFANITIVDANCVVPIPDSMNFEQAAGAIYALTIEYMMNKIRKGNHRAVIQNVACGYIGKAMIKYCTRNGISIINIVRRSNQADLLREMGCEYVFDSSEEGWETKVSLLAKTLKATIAFDGVAGEMTGILYDCLCEPGVLYVYGLLSNQPCLINPMSLIKEKKIKGLTLFGWLNKLSILKKTKLVEKVARLYDQVFFVNYCATVDINTFKDTLQCYRDRKTNSKILLRTRGI